jgi:hypothetical protein
MDLLLGKTIYCKRTSANGKSSIQEARVWDEARFIKTLKAQAKAEAAKEKVSPDVIELSTREAYRATTWNKEKK